MLARTPRGAALLYSVILSDLDNWDKCPKCPMSRSAMSAPPTASARSPNVGGAFSRGSATAGISWRPMKLWLMISLLWTIALGAAGIPDLRPTGLDSAASTQEVQRAHQCSEPDRGNHYRSEERCDNRPCGGQYW